MKKLYTAMVMVAALAFCSLAAATVSLGGDYARKEGSRFWTLRLITEGADHGRYALGHLNPIPFQHGSYSIQGDEITFTESGGTGECSSPGRYTVHLTGGLEFRDGVDSCVKRRDALDNGKFLKLR